MDLPRSLWHLERRESSPFAQSQSDLTAEQPQRSFLSSSAFFDSRLPCAGVLSPRSPLSDFPPPLPSPLPPPPFFSTARVVSFIYLFITPSHQHPFRTPKLFNVSGRRKGQEVLTGRGLDRASG